MKCLLFFPFLFLLLQCGQPSPPKCWITPYSVRKEKPTSSLTQARNAWNHLSHSPSLEARQNYNLAVSNLFARLRCGSSDWHAEARKLGTVIDDSPNVGLGYKLTDLEAVVPASRISLKQIGTRYQDDGIGIPVVGWKSAPTKEKRRFNFAPPTGIPLNLNATLDFSTQPPTWRFRYPGKVPQMKLGKRSEPLSVDWSASSALYWKMSDLDDADLTKVILPTRLTEHAGLFFATPYNPKKIPVVFTHGLYSSPGTYKKLYNELAGQKWFRDRYQVLFFSYPTGIAWPYNAAEFRRQIRLAQDYAIKKGKGDLTQWNKMVLIGHSMGGVISRASVIDPKEHLYNASYSKPIDELDISDSTRQAIKSVRLYKPLKAPTRVIYMASPHQGSPMADRLLFTWVSSLIRLPKTLTIDLATATLSEITKAIQQGGQTRPPLTSIGTLSPYYRPYRALNECQCDSHIKYHSIIGNRGSGKREGSSDGVVPYWSSHLDGHQSEKIVPAGHSLISHDETIAEIKRILQLHLKN